MLQVFCAYLFCLVVLTIFMFLDIGYGRSWWQLYYFPVPGVVLVYLVGIHFVGN